MSTLKRDLLHARWTAQHQADSFLHRGRESGIRYQGEADGLLIAIRMIAADDRKRWASERESVQQGGQA